MNLDGAGEGNLSWVGMGLLLVAGCELASGVFNGKF